MKLYGGIDLDSNNNVMAIVDERDRVVYQKRLPNAKAQQRQEEGCRPHEEQE